jgi:hypothetical protein
MARRATAPKRVTWKLYGLEHRRSYDPKDPPTAFVDEVRVSAPRATLLPSGGATCTSAYFDFVSNRWLKMYSDYVCRDYYE